MSETKLKVTLLLKVIYFNHYFMDGKVLRVGLLFFTAGLIYFATIYNHHSKIGEYYRADSYYKF